MSNGRFVWHDLMTPDPAAVESFYSDLFGWTVKEMDMGESFGKYRMLFAGEQSIGGIVKLDQEGAPPHWIGYATVDDVDAAVERATANGGTTHLPGTDIPEVGRFAVISDPQGAVIAPFSSAGEAMPEDTGMPPHGAFCWDELLALDPDAAKAFYGELFGWTSQAVDMGEMGTYHLMKRGERDACGMMKKPDGAPGPAAWLAYVMSDDVDATAARVPEIGGKIWVEPTDIPGIGRFCVASDPAGAMFAAYKSARQ